MVLRFTHLCTRTETRNWKHLLMALFLFHRQIPLAWSSYNPLPIYKSHSFTNKQGKCNYSDNFRLLTYWIDFWYRLELFHDGIHLRFYVQFFRFLFFFGNSFLESFEIVKKQFCLVFFPVIFREERLSKFLMKILSI